MHIDLNDTQTMDFENNDTDEDDSPPKSKVKHVYNFENNNTAKDAKDEYDSKTLIPIMRHFFQQYKDFKYGYTQNVKKLKSTAKQNTTLHIQIHVPLYLVEEYIIQL